MLLVPNTSRFRVWLLLLLRHAVVPQAARNPLSLEGMLFKVEGAVDVAAKTTLNFRLSSSEEEQNKTVNGFSFQLEFRSSISVFMQQLKIELKGMHMKSFRDDIKNNLLF